MVYEYDDDSYPEDRRPDPEPGYEDDLAVQNAVEDAKYDFAPRDEPDDWQQGAPTHYQEAQELLVAAEQAHLRSDDECYFLDAAQARATLAVADRLADVLSVLEPARARTVSAPDPWAVAGTLDSVDGVPVVWELAVNSNAPVDYRARPSEFYASRGTAEGAGEAACAKAWPGRSTRWATDSGGRSWTLLMLDRGSWSSGWELRMHGVHSKPVLHEDVEVPF